MARTIGDQLLQEIRTRIIRLGVRVETTLDDTLQAIQNSDHLLCQQVIASERSLDELRSQIERLTFQALAGKQEQVLAAAPFIAGDLEVMGDNATGIAKLLLGMTLPGTMKSNTLPLDSSAPEDGDQRVHPLIVEAGLVSELIVLGQEARHALHETLHAFAEHDASAAQAIQREDTLVDMRYHLLRHALLALLTDSQTSQVASPDAHVIQRIPFWLWVVDNLEQIGKNCIHICEHVALFLSCEKLIHPQEEALSLG
jgi:phosphate transport system protein